MPQANGDKFVDHVCDHKSSKLWKIFSIPSKGLHLSRRKQLHGSPRTAVLMQFSHTWRGNFSYLTDCKPSSYPIYLCFGPRTQTGLSIMFLHSIASAQSIIFLIFGCSAAFQLSLCYQKWIFSRADFGTFILVHFLGSKYFICLKK